MTTTLVMMLNDDDARCRRKLSGRMYSDGGGQGGGAGLLPRPLTPPGLHLLLLLLLLASTSSPTYHPWSPCYGALWQFVSWLEMPELCASDPSGRTSCAPVADGWAYCAVQQAGRSCLSCKEESCSCTTLTTSAPNQDPAPENF